MKKVTNPQLTSITLLTSVFLSACGGAGSIGPNLANTVQPVQTCSNGGVNFPTCTPPATPANLQLVVPSPPYASGSNQLEGFNYLNNLRSYLGLGLLAYSSELDRAAANHLNYLVVNRDNYNAHNEDPLRLGYTGVTPNDQVRFAGYASNIFVGTTVAAANTSPEAILRNINSVYHRNELLNQNMRDVGAALYADLKTGLAIHVLFTGRKDGSGQTNASDFMLVYPPDRATNVNLSFAGESPNPLQIEYPNVDYNGKVGYPVTFEIATGRILNLTSFILTIDGQSGSIDSYVRTTLTEENPGYLSQNQAYLITKAPLQPLTTYHATVKGTNNGISFTKEWTFTTANKKTISF
jgi:uncharacterized protein YkwD